jgi:hypothetical protein
LDYVDELGALSKYDRSSLDHRDITGVLHQRFIDSIKDQPWAGRPFNIIVNDRCADLWGFVYSVDEKTAVRVAESSRYRIIWASSPKLPGPDYPAVRVME